MLHKWSNVPIDHLKIYVEDCVNVADYIVSVGCGNGKYEYEISKSNQNLRNKFILVDPNPESFEEYPSDGKYLKINYNHTSDLIKDKPDVISNCVLLLIWPYSSYTDDSNYDYEAIELLKPNSIICLYEVPRNMDIGSSGSTKLINFFDKINDYKEISTTRYGYKGQMGNIYPKIKWIAKKNSKVPKLKKCLKLQEEVCKLSEVDLSNETACVIS